MTMKLEIDFRSGIPIYLQVVDRIKERLAAGQLKPGDQLPTVRSLALELRVNFNTIARAYRIMDEVLALSPPNRGVARISWNCPRQKQRKASGCRPWRS